MRKTLRFCVYDRFIYAWQSPDSAKNQKRYLVGKSLLWGLFLYRENSIYRVVPSHFFIVGGNKSPSASQGKQTGNDSNPVVEVVSQIVPAGKRRNHFL